MYAHANIRAAFCNSPLSPQLLLILQPLTPLPIRPHWWEKKQHAHLSLSPSRLFSTSSSVCTPVLRCVFRSLTFALFLVCSTFSSFSLSLSNETRQCWLSEHSFGTAELWSGIEGRRRDKERGISTGEERWKQAEAKALIVLRICASGEYWQHTRWKPKDKCVSCNAFF